MDIQKNVQITTKLTQEDMTELIRKHVEAQGYEVEKVVFEIENRTRYVSHQEALMGIGNSNWQEFSGATVTLREKTDVASTR